MKLTSALEHDFDLGTRSRGAQYFRTGAVRIDRASDTAVTAWVQGSRLYEVEIRWDSGELSLRCACPYFESGGPCKHLWATVLAAEAKGHLSAASIRGFIPVTYDFGNRGTFHVDEKPGYVTPERHTPRAAPPAVPPPPQLPVWRQRLNEIALTPRRDAETWPSTRELLYVVDVPSSINRGGLVIRLLAREPKRTGGWKKYTPPRLVRAMVPDLPVPLDRQIMGLLTGAAGDYGWVSSAWHETLAVSYRVQHALAATVMPLIASSGRALLQSTAYTDEELSPLVWDEAEPWRFELRVSRTGTRSAVSGWLRRGEEEMDLTAPALVTEGLVFTRDRVSRLEETAPPEWIAYLRHAGHGGRIEAADTDAEQLLAAVLEHPLAVRVEAPEELRYQEVRSVPRPCLTIRAVKPNPWEAERLVAQLWFDYDGRRVSIMTDARGVYDPAARTLLVRDREAEQAALERLRSLGISSPAYIEPGTEPAWHMAPKRLPTVVRACLEAGWHIEAEGKTFRRPGSVRVEVSSGVDWFELHGEVDYGETTAQLPALLAAVRRGDNMVRLDDGTYGLLPEEWLSRYGALAGLGTATVDHVRFRRNQAGLLDALLASQPEASCDAAFDRIRDELRGFQGIRTVEQPAGFVGQLRDYQREGVGWMEFLRRFGFGGCLADDMGVGKTAQVLALLDSRRALREASNGDVAQKPCGPSLVVVPKSLVFNWKQESARFTPQLRVLDHTGLTRSVANFAAYDLILTTYGTLRRDALEFKDLEFDYIVLDEAQAIKNAGTDSAKAVRLLRGRQRLALSGTPVENHLGELWSLFEFLNPGMLGSASVFQLTGGAARNPSEETRQLLAQALRPFILRRTKDQVARELPAKTEQTIFCELEAPQRKLYNELRTHYRSALMGAIEHQGLGKSKIQVLEALLRLRQAACHPGLLDPKRLDDPSAKLDMLMDQLADVVDEGHKALVFSQFTSMLVIVRRRLDAAGIVYEYLDGATRDRQHCVERFQTDPHCPLFLISLKAGGLGLNLTAAEYVFLLDPWWNPAVEAQAVDRAHRIGQTRQVFAYRLIARDTVEEKVLELQSTKRALAAAIISADNSPLRNLKREDIELLLS
ncbi:MAG TPA: DEAD/DEAH box helicase [Bryobacteraceae bacterium]|jgi:superfamily II DNA or RNA helicase|nr:DEAD/DEAH box helicase [Bryobacteraceae bacterium]